VFALGIHHQLLWPIQHRRGKRPPLARLKILCSATPQDISFIVGISFVIAIIKLVIKIVIKDAFETITIANAE
jgi:hypothetical protein